MTPCDLHALGTPPALILSQDQTLHQLCWHPRAGDPDREIHQPPAMPVVSVLTRGLVTSHHQLRSPGPGQPAPASSRVLARLQSPQDSRPQKDRAFGFASSSAHKPNLPQVQPLVCPLVKVRSHPSDMNSAPIFGAENRFPISGARRFVRCRTPYVMRPPQVSRPLGRRR